MNRKLIFWSLFSFVTGFLVCAAFTVDPVYFPLEQQSVEYHWNKVREYRDYMKNPENYTPVSNSNLASTRPPFDLQPHLAFLEGKGELSHFNIVLPNVPENCRPAAKYWMRFVNEHDEVIEASGVASYSGIQINGKVPFHFQVWIEPGFKDAINQLIQELEDIAASECSDDPSSQLEE